jgi:hypothetical protein
MDCQGQFHKGMQPGMGYWEVYITVDSFVGRRLNDGLRMPVLQRLAA